MLYRKGSRGVYFRLKECDIGWEHRRVTDELCSRVNCVVGCDVKNAAKNCDDLVVHVGTNRWQ